MEAVYREAQAIDLVLRKNVAFFQSQTDNLSVLIDQRISGVFRYAHAIE